jgi:hypothetical protein
MNNIMLLLHLQEHEFTPLLLGISSQGAKKGLPHTHIGDTKCVLKEPYDDVDGGGGHILKWISFKQVLM